MDHPGRSGGSRVAEEVGVGERWVEEEEEETWLEMVVGIQMVEGM